MLPARNLQLRQRLATQNTGATAEVRNMNAVAAVNETAENSSRARVLPRHRPTRTTMLRLQSLSKRVSDAATYMGSSMRGRNPTRGSSSNRVSYIEPSIGVIAERTASPNTREIAQNLTQLIEERIVSPVARATEGTPSRRPNRRNRDRNMHTPIFVPLEELSENEQEVSIAEGAVAAAIRETRNNISNSIRERLNRVNGEDVPLVSGASAVSGLPVTPRELLLERSRRSSSGSAVPGLPLSSRATSLLERSRMRSIIDSPSRTPRSSIFLLDSPSRPSVSTLEYVRTSRGTHNGSPSRGTYNGSPSRGTYNGSPSRQAAGSNHATPPRPQSRPPAPGTPSRGTSRSLAGTGGSRTSNQGSYLASANRRDSDNRRSELEIWRSNRSGAATSQRRPQNPRESSETTNRSASNSSRRSSPRRTSLSLMQVLETLLLASDNENDDAQEAAMAASLQLPSGGDEFNMGAIQQSTVGAGNSISGTTSRRMNVTRRGVATGYTPDRSARNAAVRPTRNYTPDRAERRSTVRPPTRRSRSALRSRSPVSSTGRSKSSKPAVTKQNIGSSNGDIGGTNIASILCAICLDSFQDALFIGNNLSATKCGHMFCHDCILSAVVNRGECPLCRTALLPSQIIKLHLG